MIPIDAIIKFCLSMISSLSVNSILLYSFKKQITKIVTQMKHINLTLTTLLQNFPNIKHDKQVCFFQFDKDIQVSLPKVAIARFGIGNVNEYIRFSYCFNRDFTSSTIFSACRQLITYFSLLFILIKKA